MQPPTPYRETRPWGEFIKFTENSPGTVKIITVKAGEAFSLQYHKLRDEFWYIISGNGVATVGKDQIEIIPDKEFSVPKETLHRIKAGSEDVVFLEISYGIFKEDDVVRTEDNYGRA
jgi:mannose-1-phosphate guanylyltransferase/mannose-1-phosphate guanylyltransferase/mannose-6-phosphate isomerase